MALRACSTLNGHSEVEHEKSYTGLSHLLFTILYCPILHDNFFLLQLIIRKLIALVNLYNVLNVYHFMTMKCQWVYYIKCLQQYKLHVSLEYTMAVNHSLLGKDGVFWLYVNTHQVIRLMIYCIIALCIAHACL